VSLSLANHDASLPIAYRLYLPEDWAKDQARRIRPRCRDDRFQTKPEIALEQIKAPNRWTASGCGADGRRLWQRHGLRTDITALGVRYVAGIGPNTSVWAPGEAPMPPQSRTGRGRPQTRLQRGQHQPISVKTLALSLPQEAWQTITWREGTTDWLSSRFARWRVRAGASRQLAERVAR